jgi:hypothetical protein
MHLKKLIIGEIMLLLASVFVFRSLWLMLDEYLGYSNLAPNACNRDRGVCFGFGFAQWRSE